MMPLQSYFLNPLGLVLIGALLILASGCRPEPKDVLSFEISTILAYDQSAASNILIALERRTVSDGVFNGNYELLAEGSTDAEGMLVLNFGRSNALDYLITGYGDDWFERQLEVNPDVFLGSTSQSIALEMTPKALITIRLVNANPLDEYDAIQFRTLNAPGEYPTCSNGWGTFSGSDLVEERTCLIEADRYLPYTHRTFRGGEWLEFELDSIWIERGDAVDLTILW